MKTEKEKKGQPTAMRETIADIADEIRCAVELMGDEMPYTVSARTMRRVADRLKAAWEREREELDKRISDLEAYAKLWTDRADELRLKCDEFYAKAKPVGNAAAMRDAFHVLKEMFRDIDLAHDTLEKEIYELANAALSAPARNCDLKECSTDEGIILAHESFCESWHDDGKSCAECPYNPRSPMMTCREKWLLSPAAERKGELK